MWVRGVSRAFPTFLPPILFLLFLSRRDAGISRGTARAKRKAREETFRPSTRFRSPFRSFVRSFVRIEGRLLDRNRILDRDSSILSRGILFTVPRSLAHSRLRSSRALSLSVPRRVSR